MPSAKDRLKARAQQPGGLALRDFTPATGIGRFDARYDPNADVLHITLKVFYQWTRQGPSALPWDGAVGDQQEFKAAFKKVVEETWSERHQLAADKDEKRDIHARVLVRVEEVASQNAAHYTLNINNFPKGMPSGAGVNPVTRAGDFGRWDIYPEERVDRDQKALEFKMHQAEDAIARSKTDLIPFEADNPRASLAVNTAIAALVQGLRPILSPELAESEFALYVHGKASAAEAKKPANAMLGKGRAQVVKELLERSLPYKVKVLIVESAAAEPWLAAKVQATLQKYPNLLAMSDVQNQSFAGVMVLVKDPGVMGLNLAAGIRRNYIIVAHESGHMFGLPDEYLGVNCMNLKDQVDVLSIIPKVKQNLTNIPANPDPRLVSQADGFANLVLASNVPTPVFMSAKSTVTTSIMYAGSDVLPAHYLTFWEAMLQAVNPELDPEDLKIVPNPAGQGKKSNIEHYAH